MNFYETIIYEYESEFLYMKVENATTAIYRKAEN